ncbi:MAG: GLPGLI family protein [Gemmatimonadetes bacterium]|nr:GLPGLI family protein [Gemmatimonadota bacterium]
MVRRIALALMIPTAVTAQEGRIAFNYAVQLDFEMPERLRDMDIPTSSNTPMVLLFKGSESMMIPVPEEPRPAGSERDRRAQMMMSRFRRGSPMRASQERIRETYSNHETQTVTETREFMGRTFLISDERPDYRWTLAADQREFMGYVVQKATAEHDGAQIEAWFTPQIPVPGGPGNFGGLPGMILVLTIDSGKTVYSATDIDLRGVGDVIVPPGDGDLVTRAEYEEIVVEKLEELRSVRGAGRPRRPFQGRER